MKNYLDLKAFLEKSSPLDREQFLQGPEPFLTKALFLSLVDPDSLDLKEAALNSLDDYLFFLNKFYHPEIEKTLLFPDTKLLHHLLPTNTNWSKVVIDQLNWSDSELVMFFENYLGFSLKASWSVKENLLILDPSFGHFKSLLPNFPLLPSDEISLLSSAYEYIPLELNFSDNKLYWTLENRGKNFSPSGESLIQSFNMMVSRFAPLSKYVGIALALNLSFISESSASPKDSSKYLQSLNKSLSELNQNLPKGCKFGTKIIGQNSFNLNYEIYLGDYTARVKFSKLGSFSETLDQSIYRQKDLKGCGLSEADATQMAHKVSNMVVKLWEGK